nr:amidohydrolase family protein [Auraticoccus cholistanensis]
MGPRLRDTRGAEVVAADGLVLCPGFVDLHSHADFTVGAWPAADTQLAQGVTTLLVGNCGFSPFPVDEAGWVRRATRFLAEEELAWDWDDADGFARAVERVRPAVNVATQVGHCTVRAAVVGPDERAATPAEMERMAAAVRAAARAGAVGLSTGLIYAPGTFADEAEVRALLAVAASAGLVHSTHIRDESAGLVDAVREALDHSRATGVGLELSHLKAIGPAYHGTVGTVLDLVDEAVADGVDVQADVYPYTATSTSLMSRLPGWALDGGPEAMQARLADPATRARVAAAVEERSGRAFDPAGVVLSSVSPGPWAWAVGRSLAELAAERGVGSTEVMLDVLTAHGAGVAMVNHALAEDDVVQVLRHPRVSVASDGWVLRPEGEGRPHPRSFGTFARVLARYVRELGVLTLPEAVHKMTGLPARRIRLADRGVLRPGAVADLVLLDPDRVADRSTFTEPWQLATGVEKVWVAGRLAWSDQAVTGERAGRLLRRPAR